MPGEQQSPQKKEELGEGLLWKRANPGGPGSAEVGNRKVGSHIQEQYLATEKWKPQPTAVVGNREVGGHSKACS
jgi:hypothetical protein